MWCEGLNAWDDVAAQNSYLSKANVIQNMIIRDLVRHPMLVAFKAPTRELKNPLARCELIQIHATLVISKRVLLGSN